MNKNIKLGLLVLTIVAMVGVPGALAYSSYMQPLQTLYGSGLSCGTCHVNPNGGGARNAYGQLFESQANHQSDPTAALTAIGAPPGTTPTPTPTPTTTPTPTPAPTTTPTPTATPGPTPVSGAVTTAEVTFVVTDNNTGLPIDDARVLVNRTKIKTDDTGTAVFDDIVPGNYTYKVRTKGYVKTKDYISVTGNMTVTVKLVPEMEEDEHAGKDKHTEKEERDGRIDVNEKSICSNRRD